MQCWRSVTFWCGSGSGSPDPYLWLKMDPNPTPDPTTFFNDLMDLINKVFPIFFSYNLPTDTSSSVLKIYFFLLKFVLKCYFIKHFFQSAQHINGKREGSGAGAGSIPLTIGSGSGSGRPKNMRIMRIRIPNTALMWSKVKTKPYANHIHGQVSLCTVTCYIVIYILSLVLWFYVLIQNDLKGWKKNYSDCPGELPYLVQLLLEQVDLPAASRIVHVAPLPLLAHPYHRSMLSHFFSQNSYPYVPNPHWKTWKKSEVRL